MPKLYFLLIVFLVSSLLLQAQDTTLTEPIRTYSGHSEDISAIAYSFDGRMIATGGWDKRIILWDADSSYKLFELSGHNSAIVSLAFSRNNKLLLSTSNDGSAILWDIAKKAAIRTFYSSGNRINSGAMSPDPEARVIALAVSDGTVKVYDKEKKYEQVRNIDIEGNVPTSIAFDNTGRFVVIGCSDNSVRTYNPLSGQIVQIYSGHTGRVNSVTFSNDGRYIISGANDRTAIIWNARSGAVHATLTGHTWNVQSVAFNARGNFAVTSSNDGTARLWDVESGELLRIFRPEVRDNFLSVIFSPDSKTIFTTSRVRNVTEAGIKVWETGIEIRPNRQTPGQGGVRPGGNPEVNPQPNRRVIRETP